MEESECTDSDSDVEVLPPQEILASFEGINIAGTSPSSASTIVQLKYFDSSYGPILQT